MKRLLLVTVSLVFFFGSSGISQEVWRGGKLPKYEKEILKKADTIQKKSLGSNQKKVTKAVITAFRYFGFQYMQQQADVVKVLVRFLYSSYNSSPLPHSHLRRAHLFFNIKKEKQKRTELVVTELVVKLAVEEWSPRKGWYELENKGSINSIKSGLKNILNEDIIKAL